MGLTFLFTQWWTAKTHQYRCTQQHFICSEGGLIFRRVSISQVILSCWWEFVLFQYFCYYRYFCYEFSWVYLLVYIGNFLPERNLGVEWLGYRTTHPHKTMPNSFPKSFVLVDPSISKEPSADPFPLQHLVFQTFKFLPVELVWYGI